MMECWYDDDKYIFWEDYGENVLNLMINFLKLFN
jgi:hypothetical protein